MSGTSSLSFSMHLMPDETKPHVPTALDELCRAYGVATEYHDIWGKVHRASDATRRAILKALGALGEGQDLQAALRERELRSWSTITPPVAVFRVDAAPYRMTPSSIIATRSQRRSASSM